MRTSAASQAGVPDGQQSKRLDESETDHNRNNERYRRSLTEWGISENAKACTRHSCTPETEYGLSTPKISTLPQKEELRDVHRIPREPNSLSSTRGTFPVPLRMIPLCQSRPWSTIHERSSSDGRASPTRRRSHARRQSWDRLGSRRGAHR